MGSGLLLAWDVSAVLPMELNTGSSKKPAKMFSREGSSGVLLDPGIVAFEKGWSVGDALMV